MMKCYDCPIMCGAERNDDETGVCGVGRRSFVARAARHYYEEPPISGTRGSGAIFFTGCNMRCVFCQNHDISRGGSNEGGAVSLDEYDLADVMLRLEELEAHNINLVTPTPHIKLIERAVPIARARGSISPSSITPTATNARRRSAALRGWWTCICPILNT